MNEQIDYYTHEFRRNVTGATFKREFEYFVP